MKFENWYFCRVILTNINVFHNFVTGWLGTFSLGNFKGRIPTWNDPDYFDLYRNPYSERTYPKVSYCRDLFNVSRDFFYFLLSPKFIATIIGIVTVKMILFIIEWGSKNIKWGIKKYVRFEQIYFLLLDCLLWVLNRLQLRTKPR